MSGLRSAGREDSRGSCGEDSGAMAQRNVDLEEQQALKLQSMH